MIRSRDTSHLTTHFFSELFGRKLLGRTDIEDALKRLDSLIQEEVQMAIAQILKATTEVKDGMRPIDGDRYLTERLSAQVPTKLT